MSQVVCGSAFQWRVTCLWALCQNPSAPSSSGSESRRALSPPAGVESPRGGAGCCPGAGQPGVLGADGLSLSGVFFPLLPRTVPQWLPHRCSWSAPESLQSQFPDRGRPSFGHFCKITLQNLVSDLLALMSCSVPWLVRTLRQSHHEFVPICFFLLMVRFVRCHCTV